MDRNSEEWKKLRSMSTEEYNAYKSPNNIKNVPQGFKTWCETHKEKLTKARKANKLPYFVRDNEKVVGKIVGWKEEKTPRKKILEAAKARHEARTPEKEAMLREYWAKKVAEGDARRKHEAIMEAAKKRHEARTEEQIADIKRRWNDRKVGATKIKHETINDLKERLGDYLPKTLGNIENAINDFENSVLYGRTEKKYKERIEQIMKEVFNKHDFGMNINDTTLELVLKSRFKNTFETGTSGGVIDETSTEGKISKKNKRLYISHKMFGLDKDLENGQLLRADYEKYGSLLDHNILRSMTNNTALQYGNVEVRFKKDKVLATWTAGDTLGGRFQPSLVSDPKSCSFGTLVKAPTKTDIQTDDFVKFRNEHVKKYIELQYHGDLTIDCVDSLTFPYDLKSPSKKHFLDIAESWKEKGAKIYYINNGELYQL